MKGKTDPNYSIVYRVENKRHRGPFTNETVHNSTYDAVYYSKYAYTWHHPNPYSDPLLNGIKHNQVVGCNSMTQLHHWFTPTQLSKMAEKGYHVVSYRVPTTLIERGKFQILFRLCDAIKLDK